MKKEYRPFGHIGTLCCLGALVILWIAVLTLDWLTIQQPRHYQFELDKLGPYEEGPQPHLIRAKFGLFKMCVQEMPSGAASGGRDKGQVLRKTESGQPPTPLECHDLDWYNFQFLNWNFEKKATPTPIPTELIANCIQKLRLTLPFIALSLLFTTLSFLSLVFGHFCQKNKKIIEASLLILGGLSQATALLSFVSQIGSEFEANLPLSHEETETGLRSFYRYKYGFSFYLFLLSFGLSELGAFFNMVAFFRKYPPSQYIITFQTQPEIQPHRNPEEDPEESFISLLPPCSDPRTKDQRTGPDLCNSFAPVVGQSGSSGLGLRVMDHVAIPPPQSYMNTETATLTINTLDRKHTNFTQVPHQTPYATLNKARNHSSIHMQSFGTLRKENNV